MANLGPFNLGRALAWPSPLSPGEYGISAHNLPAQFLAAHLFLLWSTLHMALLEEYFAMQL